MNISNFFIDRPIFASVLSLFVFIAGAIAVWRLPIAEYPQVAPPSVVVRAMYPGASPKVISETVAAPLEEQINGVENMLYLSSQATTDGNMAITITFKLGTDADKAQQLVQNRVSQALPRLPDVVRALGVTTVKSSSDLTMVVHLYSPNNRYDLLYLRNYALLNIKDKLSQVPGVGETLIFGGGDYAMRLWLNPQKIAERHLTAQDIVAAVRQQNTQVAGGIVGGSPYGPHVQFELPVNVAGRLQSIEEFENIIVKADGHGAVTRLKDVARIELGSSDYALRSLLNNKPAVALGIFQTSDANALEISTRIHELMKGFKKNFPEGVDYDIVYDPTTFVRESIKAVIETLLEAVALVVLVVIVFLQTWRASIIPLLAVPISIVGTFTFLLLFGFSINALTLFGLVLAIGIVVDDAIVVVENVERNIEKGLSSRDATIVAMREVSGPIIAIALTLCAVFVPIAFISGLTGQFYRQFALTIAISTVISAFNSLTLSPALAALLLRSHDAPKDWFARFLDRALGWFFRPFNHFFHRSSERYSGVVSKIIHHRVLAMFIYLMVICSTWFAFQHVPTGYVPAQDKQYLIAFALLPGGSSLDRSEVVMRKMSEIARNHPGVESAVAFPGLSIAGFSNSPNAGIVFVTLKPFDQRKTPELSGFAIAQALNAKYMGIQDAFISIFPPPPVPGLGTIGGFKLEIQDRSDAGYDALYGVTQAIMGKAYQTPGLANVFSSFQINTPQLQANVDRVRTLQMGIPLQDVFDALQIFLGSYYINDFNLFGRTFRVIAQADAPYRAHKEDIANIKVRNPQGEMVPLGSLINVTETYGPDRATRYNGFRSADMNGGPAPGVSSGQAQEMMEKILHDILPKGMSFEWTDLTYQQILAGNSAIYIFPLCVFFVFLVLAAQYESLALPLAVILIVPMCLLCAITGVWLAGKDNNIFTQIGFIVLVGLACKNAILIVEFARELERQGMRTYDAAVLASKQRLRPILMTSFAFIMGVIPLVVSTGAGSEMRNNMGVSVFSGMLGVTFFGLLLTPMFYVLLRFIAMNLRGEKHEK
ncbi:MAG: efflux RND transporter permease subunit [Alphaproteobacteria bacterium]|nr:efflux RND transporter permease subunit [Alphaproteobacteria bacterium]